MTAALSQPVRNGPVRHGPIRSWHWALALLLAVALHLFVYLGLVSGVATAPVLRGGGSYGANGDQATPEGLRVGLAPPSRPPAPTPTPQEPAEQASATPEAAQTEVPPAPAPIEGPAPTSNENPTPAQPAAPVPQAVEAQEAAEVQETVEVPPQDEPAPVEPRVAEAAQLQEAEGPSSAPPVPSRKPAPPPLPKPELGLLEERLPLEGPAPTPTDQSQTASVPADDAPAGEANDGEISELRHVEGEGAVGTASLNSDGQIPKLNYKDQVLLWVKRHGSYPRESRRFKHEGTVLLHFVIDRSGEILYYNIRKSSGYFLLDQAVKKMMERSSPVPPIPAQISQDEIEFTVPVQFFRNLG